jgi:hypothetical protein
MVDGSDRVEFADVEVIGYTGLLLIWNDLSSTPTSAAILGAFGTPAEQSR